MKIANWDDLAMAYKKETGKSAYTRSMDKIFDWAVSRTDLFTLNTNGTLTIVEKKNDKTNQQYTN